jgi:hypothetical protein
LGNFLSIATKRTSRLIRDVERQRDPKTGLLPSQMLREAVALGREILSPQPMGDDQIQPAASI